MIPMGACNGQKIDQAIGHGLEGVSDIREQLGGELTDVIRVKAAVADQLVGEDAIVLPGCSVEFLPPLSGG